MTQRPKSLVLSASGHATGAVAQGASKTLLYQIVETVLEGIEAHAIDNVGDEGLHQQATGLLDTDAASAHIEQGVLIELADS